MRRPWGSVGVTAKPVKNGEDGYTSAIGTPLKTVTPE